MRVFVILSETQNLLVHVFIFTVWTILLSKRRQRSNGRKLGKYADYTVISDVDSSSDILIIHINEELRIF